MKQKWLGWKTVARGRLFLFGATWLAASAVLAHDSPSSSVMLDFYRDRVGAELTPPLAELELGFKPPLLAEPAAAAVLKSETALKECVAAHVNPETGDGEKWSVEVQSLKRQTNSQPFDLVAQVTMTPPAGFPARKFNINYSVLGHEMMSRCALVFVRNDWDTTVFSGTPEPLGQIHFTVASLAVHRSHGSWTRGLSSVFNRGRHHIAEGADHLLFPRGAGALNRRGFFDYDMICPVRISA